jgi:flagellar basal-body rod protein FlgC
MSDMLSHFDVSGSALTAERARMRVTASNIANANATRTPEGGPYRRQFAVFETQPEARSSLDFGVRVSEIVEDPGAPRLIYEPNHPDADEHGYVAYPNIDMLREATVLKTASMAYQANLSVINTQKQIIRRSLDIAK